MQRGQIIIVGAGPAGVAAAVQCRRLGAAPLLLDRTGAAGGLVENAYSIENYPGLEEPLGGPEFAERMRGHLERFGLAVERLDVAAVAREGDEFVVACGADELRAPAVILASGTEPLRLGLSNERECEGSALFYDVRSLLRRHPRPREVVVAGGGEAACDYALTLASVGASVHIVVRSNRLKARGRLAEAVRRASAVRVSYETACDRITMSSSFAVRLRSAAAGEAREREIDALLVAVGRRSMAPRLLGSIGCAPPGAGGAWPAGLFVAGDAREGSLGQIGMAVGDGIRAAAAAVSFVEDRR